MWEYPGCSNQGTILGRVTLVPGPFCLPHAGMQEGCGKAAGAGLFPAASPVNETRWICSTLRGET